MKQQKLKIGCLIFPQVCKTNSKETEANRCTLHKMSPSEQEKLNALLARAMYASGTPFCMIDNSHWQASLKLSDQLT